MTARRAAAMGVAYQKGMVLFRQRRWRQAAEQFQLELSANPTSAGAFSMLALSFVNDKQLEPAYAAAGEAVRLNPQHAQGHWAMAHVLLRRKDKLRWFQYSGSGQQLAQRRRLHAAKKSLLEAIRLCPFEPSFFELLSSIEADLRRWEASLEAAERGLAVSPQHVGCANRRAMLLNHLGRAGEARAEIDRALQIDPEHALTHRNRGWVLLQAGAVAAAREHFEQSLRIDPSDRRAQAGLREARRARFAPYRWMLRLALWANLAGNRWVVIVSAIAAGLLSGLNEDRLHMPKPLAVTVAIAEAAAVGAACFAAAAVVRRSRWRRRWRGARTVPAQPVEAS